MRSLLLRPQQGNPHQALKYKGMFDIGCSRHMIGNKALLTDYQDIDGGFVAFGGSTKGGKITGIGKIRTILVGDEVVHKEFGDRIERAATTASSLEAEQDSEQLGVFSAAKVLADTAEQGRRDENIHTYTRQKRRVNTVNTLVSYDDVSTASEMVSTIGLKARDKGKAVMQESELTKKIKKRIQVQMSIDEELAQKLHVEELARFNVEQEAINIARKEKVVAEGDQAHDIDWSDPAVIRYHAFQNRPRNVAEKFRDQKEQFKKLRDNLLKKKRERKVMIVASQQERKHLLGKEHVDMIVKKVADRSSKNYKILSEMLDDFDRQDVMDLHRLVEERYTTTSPEGYDLMLWGDLNTLFEPDEKNELWKNQHEYNLISYRLCDSSGIHVLLMDNGIAIHMLIEKKYPLGQEMISKILSKRLEVNQESEMAFELLRFIRSQVHNSEKFGSILSNAD
uniref:Uncharacterized protein n=1 Tax=Tanacetum cinerariifolium TaxID=118510 RepID=A0A6L2NN15_TANCI|nr:hypothetical protein [Tanacetum cinerariifolium]